jgi:hypothetical protein
MTSLILKDENLMTSPPIVGYKVIGYMDAKKTKRISIYDVADHFRNEKWFTPKALYFAMLFLFSLDIIDFNNSYIVKKPNAEDK